MIYFIRCGHDGPIKIGFTDGDIGSRLVFLQCGCPWRLTIMGTMAGDMIRETELHRAFGHLSMRGEWFHPTAELVDFIAANSNESTYRTRGRRSHADRSSLEAVKEVLGGSTGIARAIGNITPQAVSQWKKIPSDKVVPIEAASGVSRHVLRPDIFGPAPQAAAAA